MCFLRRKKNKPKKKRREPVVSFFNFDPSTGPRESDYDKTSLLYQCEHNRGKEKKTSFDDDSSMTP